MVASLAFCSHPCIFTCLRGTNARSKPEERFWRHFECPRRSALLLLFFPTAHEKNNFNLPTSRKQSNDRQKIWRNCHLSPAFEMAVKLRSSIFTLPQPFDLNLRGVCDRLRATRHAR
eukprot:scaffold1960_cov242-Pinguiococcus_pyrenoidosus.AAC.14